MATTRIDHPASHTMTIGIYRCSQCRETRWGPRLDNPDILVLSDVWLTREEVVMVSQVLNILPPDELKEVKTGHLG